MPRHTDIRIEELCTRTKAAQTETEASGVLKELQATLSEHIELARESLEAQVSTLSTLEAKARKPRSRKLPQP